jgi:hypothetical protein
MLQRRHSFPVPPHVSYKPTRFLATISADAIWLQKAPGTRDTAGLDDARMSELPGYKRTKCVLFAFYLFLSSLFHWFHAALGSVPGHIL